MEHTEILSAVYKPPSLLPIARHKQSLLYTIETYQFTILVGATGSGKSTQLPQFLYHGGWCNDGKSIAITQPRRVAATSVAKRVAEEMEVELGQKVGYSIRFEDLTSAATKIKYLTDGMLLREALVDPLLTRYSVIVVDEAHERSLSSDVLLGLLKKICKRRPDLRVVISSATIQAQDFLDYFMREEQGNPIDNASQEIACIISIEGRAYPVDILYSESPVEDYVTQAVNTILAIHAKEAPSGAILVFLPGRADIDAALTMLNEQANDPLLQAMPLYASLPTEQQSLIFDPVDPPTARKVILATNIAEASITIDDVRHVIDCGFVKLRALNPSTGIPSLLTVPVSRASADQRAGRAGRTAPGKCWRLYTRTAHAHLAASTPPESQRADLAPTVLLLKALGIDNVARFAWLAAPPARLLVRALEMLFAVGALDAHAKLSRPLGVRMAETGLPPMLGKVVLGAAAFGVVGEMASVAAMTSVGGAAAVWLLQDGEGRAVRRRFAAAEGDHVSLLNAFTAFVRKGRLEARWCHAHGLNYQVMLRAVSVRKQLVRALERYGFEVDGPGATAPTTTATTTVGSAGAGNNDNNSKTEAICRCLTSGYFAHAAKMQADGSFRSVNGATFFAHPSSLMFNRKAEWVVFHEVVETGNKTYIQDICKIQREWLTEYAPEYYKSS